MAAVFLWQWVCHKPKYLKTGILLKKMGESVPFSYTGSSRFDALEYGYSRTIWRGSLSLLSAAKLECRR
jgi:hypothetical protein